VRFQAEIKNGKTVWYAPDRVIQFIAGLEGCRITVEIKKLFPRRSNNQNAWYWACIIPLLGESCGYDPEEMHSALKERFLRIHGDSPLPTVRSTSTLSTKDFSEYCENCRRLAAEMGVVIPDPGEY
jgi:hypothetical protein